MDECCLLVAGNRRLCSGDCNLFAASRAMICAQRLTIVLLTLLAAAGCRQGDARPIEEYIEADAGGHRLHMLVVGETGPTVILESGWPGCGLGWDRVRG